jgi:hypothetical protein
MDKLFFLELFDMQNQIFHFLAGSQHEHSRIIRSDFKTSDQVQGQGVRPIRRRPPTSAGLWRDKSGKRSIH